MDLHIIPECYIDTKLIKVLVPPNSKGYNHQKGCNNVVNVMKENFRDDFALGIIDNDKREVGYLEEFETIYTIENSLELYKHSEKHHWIIIICPAMERWIFNSLEELGLDIEEYGFPNDMKAFCKITKTATSEEKDPNSAAFKTLFKDIKEAKAAIVLAFWVSYLRDNNYEATEQELIEKTAEILA